MLQFKANPSVLQFKGGRGSEKMKELGDAFTAIDVNNDGLIDLAEFTTVSVSRCVRATATAH